MAGTTARRMVPLNRFLVVTVARPAGLSIVGARFAASSIFEGADGGGKKGEGE